MVDLEGRTLARYELQQLIGRGGMADVYLAFDPHFERDVAVKVFKRQDEEMLRRFIREARLMASLRHPNLMPIYDAGESRIDRVPQYYIVMPVMPGGTLRARIRRNPLPLAQTCQYLREIASALDYIHAQGIIHRDIKSSNVLLDADDHCFLSDFGIAHTASDATQLTSTGNVLGTVDYVAPELFEPHTRANALSDLYSLGILLFEMVTGHLPFTGATQIAVVAMHVSKRPPLPRTFVPDIAPQVERVMLRTLEKDPAQRYQSASELADAFCSAVSAPRELDVFASSPVWDDVNTVVQPARDEPLVLAPSPVVPRVSQAAPATAAYPQGPYKYTPPAYPGADAQPAPGSRRGRIVALLALLTLLAIAVPVFYIAVINPPKSASVVPSPTAATSAVTPTPNLTATAQVTGATATAQASQKATATAQAVATATVQASKNATATAVVAPTATAQAQVTATAGVIQTVTAGAASYTDPLTNANNPATQKAQWDADTTNCVFQSNGYHVLQKASGLSDVLKGCIETGYSYVNMAASVDVTIVSGSSGGIFFRTTNQGLGGAYAGYLLEVNTQGQYRFSRSNNFSLPGATILQDWTVSPALKTGDNTKNTLQVWANGGTLDLYANNVFLKSVQNTTFTTGNIAFLARTTSGGADADVYYTNLQVFPK